MTKNRANTIVLTEGDLIEMVKTAIVEIYDGISGGAYNGGRYLSRALTTEGKTPIYSSLKEGIEFEPSPNEKGGIITFSMDVNAENQSENKVINFLKQKMMTILNRIYATKKVDRIAAKHNLVGWTIGHYLDSRYTDPKTKQQYGENSLSVEIIGVDYETLEKISMELCEVFKQKSVLLKDYSSGRILFIDRT